MIHAILAAEARREAKWCWGAEWWGEQGRRYESLFFPDLEVQFQLHKKRRFEALSHILHQLLRVNFIMSFYTDDASDDDLISALQSYENNTGMSIDDDKTVIKQRDGSSWFFPIMY